MWSLCSYYWSYSYRHDSYTTIDPDLALPASDLGLDLLVDSVEGMGVSSVYDLRIDRPSELIGTWWVIEKERK
jgi:hypothetical protein